MPLTPSELQELGKFSDAEAAVIRLLKERFNNLGALDLQVLASKIVHTVLGAYSAGR